MNNITANDEITMANALAESISTRVLNELYLVKCPNCGNYMYWMDDGPACEQINDGDPSFVEYVGFTCDTCGLYAIVSQVFVPTNFEVYVNAEEVN